METLESLLLLLLVLLLLLFLCLLLLLFLCLLLLLFLCLLFLLLLLSILLLLILLLLLLLLDLLLLFDALANTILEGLVSVELHVGPDVSLAVHEGFVVGDWVLTLASLTVGLVLAAVGQEPADSVVVSIYVLNVVSACGGGGLLACINISAIRVLGLHVGDQFAELVSLDASADPGAGRPFVLPSLLELVLPDALDAPVQVPRDGLPVERHPVEVGVPLGVRVEVDHLLKVLVADPAPEVPLAHQFELLFPVRGVAAL